jgi:hypothetical protein
LFHFPDRRPGEAAHQADLLEPQEPRCCGRGGRTHGLRWRRGCRRRNSVGWQVIHCCYDVLEGGLERSDRQHDLAGGPLGGPQAVLERDDWVEGLNGSRHWPDLLQVGYRGRGGVQNAAMQAGLQVTHCAGPACQLCDGTGVTASLWLRSQRGGREFEPPAVHHKLRKAIHLR